MDIILEENPNPFTRAQNNQSDDLESEQLLPESTEDGHLNAALEDTADTATPFLAPEVSRSEKKRDFETLTYPVSIAGEIDTVENLPEGHPHFDTALERQSDGDSISQGRSIHADDTLDRWNADDSDTEGVGGILRQGQSDHGAVPQLRCPEIPHRDGSIRLRMDSSRVTNYRIPNSATCENCCKCCGNKHRVSSSSSSCQIQMAGAGEAFSAKSTENGSSSRGDVLGPQICSCFAGTAANQPEVNGHCSPERVRCCLADNTRETERQGMCLLKEFPQSGRVSKVTGPDRLARCDNPNDCAQADNCFSSPRVPDCPLAQGPLDDRPGASSSAQSGGLDLDSMSRLETDRMRREFPEQKTTSDSSPGGSRGSRLGNTANISDRSDIKCEAINGDRQPSKPICSRLEEGSYVERDGKSAGGSSLSTHQRHGGLDSESRHLSSSDSRSSSNSNDTTAPACKENPPPSECGHGDKSLFIVDHLEPSSDYSAATLSSSGKDSGCQSQAEASVFDMGESQSPSQSPRVKESSFIVQPGSNVTDPLKGDSCKEWPQKCKDCPFCELKLGKNEINLDVLRLTPSSGSNNDTSCDEISIPSCSPKKKGPGGSCISEQEHGNFSVSSVTFETDVTIPNPAQVVFDALKQNLDTDRLAKRKLRQQQAHLEESPIRQCKNTGEDQDIGLKSLGYVRNFDASMDNETTHLPSDSTPSSFPTLPEQVTSDGATSPAPDNVPDNEILKTPPGNAKPEGNVPAKDDVHCRCRHEKSLAPPLDDQWLYHIFFLYHHGDHPWVLDLVRQLESAKLDFKCCCLWREMSHASSVLQMAAFGLRNSCKTVIIASPDFISELWYCSDPHVLSETDIFRRHRDIIVLDRFSCDLPRSLANLTYIDFRGADWWNRLLMQVTYREEPRVLSQERNHISVTLGPTAGLQSGYLLVSLKSRYDCCGKEVVDPTKVPSDLIGYGVQISEEDYEEAVSCLMSDPKFRCHVWCYNVPAAIVFFALLLGACLAVIPLMESELILHSKDTGVEFVHAGIIWLCILTAYLFAMHIAKKRMKSSTYSKLMQMNSVLVKYNLLAGVENLGLADCNKYYLHLFYFEMGPCMAYLQEFMLGLDESTVAIETPFANHASSSENEPRSNRLSGNDVDHVITGSDQSQVLEATQMTNAAMQTGAEALLLAKSGEYLSQLITKKLAHPHTTRHVQNAICLCQYVEQNIFKLPV